VRAGQLEAALALEPDLASVVAGLNDLLRPRGSARAAAAEVEAMQAALAGAGATVVAITLPDLSGFMPVARLVRGKLSAYNEALRAASARTGAVLVDLERVPLAADPRLWSADRLHANAEGHARIAAAVAQALGLPGADGAWAEPLAPVAPRRRVAALAGELDWSRRHLAPWIARRATGRSSGDGVMAKRPELRPLENR